MNSEELAKLRQYHRSLTLQQKIIDGFTSKDTIVSQALQPLEQVLHDLNQQFPTLVPIFEKHNYFSHSQTTVGGGRVHYDLTGIRFFVADVVARLEAELEQRADPPGIARREFTFIVNQDLRRILERDYVEMLRAQVSGCWKSVIVLSGGAIETILTDLLMANDARARAAKAAPSKPNITEWELSQLITVAYEIGLVSSGVQKLSDPVRQYRNLVHPGNELRYRLQFGEEEARIAALVLDMLCRDLTNGAISNQLP